MKINGAYYRNMLLQQQLLPAVYYLAGEFAIFQHRRVNIPLLTVQLTGCVRVFRRACGSKVATSGNLSDSEVINPLIFGIKRLMHDDYTINSCVTFQIYAKNQCPSFTRYSDDALRVRWSSLHVSCPGFSSLYNGEGILKFG